MKNHRQHFLICYYYYYYYINSFQNMSCTVLCVCVFKNVLYNMKLTFFEIILAGRDYSPLVDFLRDSKRPSQEQAFDMQTLLLSGDL